MSEPEKTESELDKLLEEAKPDDKPTIKLLNDIRENQEKMLAATNADREQKTQADVEKAVKTLIEKVPEAMRGLPNFSPEALEDLLTRRAESDEAFKTAFLSRHQNKGGWEKALGSFAEEYGKGFESMPDLNATEDREAALASASRETKPTDEEFDEAAVGKMSTQEFNDLQLKHGVRPYGT